MQTDVADGDGLFARFVQDPDPAGDLFQPGTVKVAGAWREETTVFVTPGTVSGAIERVDLVWVLPDGAVGHFDDVLLCRSEGGLCQED